MTVFAPDPKTMAQSDGANPPRARCVWCKRTGYRTRFGWWHSAIRIKDDPRKCAMVKWHP